MAITNIIFDYLKSNRRITVPALGTFLSKGGGEALLFSEFMKGDDGVLRGLLCEKEGVSELEAAIAIDRFVFDLRHEVECGGRYAMPQLGYMSSAEGGKGYLFEYDPSVRAAETVEMSETTEAADSTEVATAAEGAAEAAEGVNAPSKRSPESVYEQLFDEGSSAAAEDYVDVAAEEEDTHEQSPAEGDVEQIFGRRAGAQSSGEESTRSRGRVDLWLIVGVVAAIFAVFAVLFGVLVQWEMGNISFGEPIDSYVERLVGSNLWDMIQSIITPAGREVQSLEEIIPQDTIYI